MSDIIKHECGIAFVRLLKPLDYYLEQYGTPLYGLKKLQLLLQKQRNRGQDGAGLATIKLDMPPGTRYISRKRSNASDPLRDLLLQVNAYFKNLPPETFRETTRLKQDFPFTGEVLLGHLRYATHGKNSIEQVHPVLRQNNWMSRTLLLAGNFNLTNVDELFAELVELGQFPKEKSDTVTVLEKIGHFLEDEVQRLFDWYKRDGYSNREVNDLIFRDLNIQRILQRATKKFDGGYVMVGMIGHGDAFVMRDPHGIRPAYYYQDDEVVVCCSERPPIQTAFNVHFSKVEELPPAHVLIVKKDGRVSVTPFAQEEEGGKKPKITPCSFERIYFSRGTDSDIYTERKKLGEQLTEKVLKAIRHDLKNTVFSFVPNTAETSFYGLIEGMKKELARQKAEKILALGEKPKPKKLEKILAQQLRIEKIVTKDAKLRTFIADGESRDEMVSHVYDVTYGIVQNAKDHLVLVDDSIVRGTTLRDSILRIVSRLRPKKIVVVSSAPQIRYPDCYGIDMSRMWEFAAFRALIALIKEHGKEEELEKTLQKCLQDEKLPIEKVKNRVAPLYELFDDETITAKMAEILTPPDIKPEVQLIFQSIKGLHAACPKHAGDWYFSGKYPTPGGNRVVNRAFINYMQGKSDRAY